MPLFGRPLRFFEERGPMGEIHFRLATIADLDVLVSFMQQFYALDQYPFDELIARSALTMLIEESSLGRLWIISNEEAIGYIAVTFGYSLEFHGRDAMIDELFLAAPHRHQGIGTKTLQFVAQQCRHLGIHALHLEVEHTNEAGLRLYRHLGFEPHEQRYLMTKWIEP
jgi:GNAT superfamily N-acetyltransferase